MPSTRPALPTDLEGRWTAYLGAEGRGVRLRALDMPAEFIGALELVAASAKYPWAIGLSCAVADGDEDLPIRAPLFHLILLPALLNGIDERLRRPLPVLSRVPHRR